MFDSGRIDATRYADLSTEKDAKRIEVLMQMRRALSGRDPAFDSLLEEAISGKDDAVLRPLLAKLVHSRGLGASQIERINRPGNSMLETLAHASTIVQHFHFQEGSQMKDTLIISNSTLTNSPVAIKQELTNSYNTQLAQARSADIKTRLNELVGQVAEVMAAQSPEAGAETKKAFDILMNEGSLER